MKKISREELLSLEEYSNKRAEFRAKVIEYRKRRRLLLGPHASLHFEDRITMWYQIQEMLRAERIFEAAGIQEEIDTYNELVPDGTNWKATLLFEYEDAEERAIALARMPGIEHDIWVDVGGCERINAIANDDIERTDEGKTAAVHFLRFEFTSEHIESMCQGKPINIGINHSELPYECEVGEGLRTSLVKDFESGVSLQSVV